MDPAIEGLRERAQQRLEACTHGGIPLLGHPAMALGLAFTGIVALWRETTAVFGLLEQVARHVARADQEETVLDLQEELLVSFREEGQVGFDLREIVCAFRVSSDFQV